MVLKYLTISIITAALRVHRDFVPKKRIWNIKLKMYTYRTAVDQKQYPGDNNTSWLQCGWSCRRVKGREIPFV